MIGLVDLVIGLVELVDFGNNPTNAGPLGLIYNRPSGPALSGLFPKHER